MANIPPFSYCTPGITEPHFCACPLGTEAEMSDGDDETNPYEPHTEQEPPEGDGFGLFENVDPFNDEGPRF